jgi:hypothetical protein
MQYRHDGANVDEVVGYEGETNPKLHAGSD